MIYFNGKEVTPKLNGVDLSRVMYNGSKIWPKIVSGILPSDANDGVYIYSNDNKLYNPNDWNTANNDSALGVAVVSGDVKFLIIKELPIMNNIPWSNALYGTDVDGILTTASQADAITDYAGESNTNIIRKLAQSEGPSNNAAYYCYNQILNGMNGYLPSAGELFIMYNNKSSINQALQLIGATTIDVALNNIHNDAYHDLWASTEYSDSSLAWTLLWESSPLYFDTLMKIGSYSSSFTFPIFPLYPYPTIFIGNNITRPFTEETLSSLLQPYVGTEYRLVVEDMVESEMTPFASYFSQSGAGVNDKLHLIFNGGFVTDIPSVFMSQTSVKSVDLSEMMSLMDIGGYSFSFNSYLESVKLPSSLTIIGGSSFAQCENLKEIEIPNSVNTIGSSAFSSCFNLKKLTIGASVLEIGESAFGNCYSLEDISFYGTNEPSIGESAFYNVSATVKVPKDYTGTMFGALAIEKVL